MAAELTVLHDGYAHDEGVASSVVTSGTSNLEVIACGACSKVFGAFPGRLIPVAEDSR